MSGFDNHTIPMATEATEKRFQQLERLSQETARGTVSPTLTYNPSKDEFSVSKFPIGRWLVKSVATFVGRHLENRLGKAMHELGETMHADDCKTREVALEAIEAHYGVSISGCSIRSSEDLRDAFACAEVNRNPQAFLRSPGANNNIEHCATIDSRSADGNEEESLGPPSLEIEDSESGRRDSDIPPMVIVDGDVSGLDTPSSLSSDAGIWGADAVEAGADVPGAVYETVITTSRGEERFTCDRMVGNGVQANIYSGTSSLDGKQYAIKVTRQDGNSTGIGALQSSSEREARLGMEFGCVLRVGKDEHGNLAQVMPLGKGLGGYRMEREEDASVISDEYEEHFAYESELFEANAVGLFEKLGKMHRSEPLDGSPGSRGASGGNAAYGYLHNDIKSDNFLVLDREVHLNDFGLSAAVADRSTGMGTPSLRAAQYKDFEGQLELYNGVGIAADERSPGLGEKAFETLLLAGYVLKHMLPKASLETYMSGGKLRETVFEAALKRCDKRLAENPNDAIALKAKALAEYCLQKVGEASSKPVLIDASDVAEDLREAFAA